MNLKDFANRLLELADERPDLADTEIIVRNVQGTETGEFGEIFPDEDNSMEPYWLGCVRRIDVDKYIADEDGARFFQSEWNDPWRRRHLMDAVQDTLIYKGEPFDPLDLTEQEIALRVEALPWKEAIVATIGVAE